MYLHWNVISICRKSLYLYIIKKNNLPAIAKPNNMSAIVYAYKMGLANKNIKSAHKILTNSLSK